MIINEYIQVKISSTNYRHYKNRGYDISKGDIIKVNVCDLTNGSKAKVNCKCDYCDNIINIVYKNYIQQIKTMDKYCCSKCSYKKRSELCKAKYGVEHTLQLDSVISKRFQTNIEIYGGVSPFSSETIRDKSKLSLIERFGVDNPFKSKEIINKIREINLVNNRWSDNEHFKTYRRKVKTLTLKNRNILFENWDGYDYYDNEYIKNNLDLNRNNSLYPTIDHKISTLYGFIYNMTPEEISDINNLCITKRYINSSKNSKTESEFKSSKSIF